MDERLPQLCLLPHLDQAVDAPIPTGQLLPNKKLLRKQEWFREDPSVLYKGGMINHWTCSPTDARVSLLKDLGKCPNKSKSGKCVCGPLVEDVGLQWKARQMYCQICSDYGHKAGNRLLSSMILPCAKLKSNKLFAYKVVIPQMDYNFVHGYLLCRRQFQYLFGLTEYRLGELTKLSRETREDHSYSWCDHNYYFEMKWSERKGPFHGMWAESHFLPDPLIGKEPKKPRDLYWPREMDHYQLFDVSLYAKCNRKDSSVSHLPDLKGCTKTRVAKVCLCWDLTHNPEAQRRARQMYVDICSAYGHAEGNRLLASMVFLKGSNSAKQPKSFYVVPIPEKNGRATMRAYQVCRGQFAALFGLEKSRLSRITSLSRNRSQHNLNSWKHDMSIYCFRQEDPEGRSSYIGPKYLWHSKPSAVRKIL